MMRRRFGRGRRNRSEGEARGIDAERWRERIAASGLVAGALEPVAAEDVPDTLAALYAAEGESGRVLVAFSPTHGGDAALAALAVGQRWAASGGLAEAIALAPEWSGAARRRLGLVAATPFRFRALAAAALAEESAAVEAEAPDDALPLAARLVAARLGGARERELFARALLAFEGLAAKHGGAVRGWGARAELVLLARVSAALRAEGAGVVLETLLPERSVISLGGEDLAAAMDRLEGTLRKRINDKRVRAGEEGQRAALVPALAEALGLRGAVLWPLGGLDPEVLDVAGIDAAGQPVVGCVRARLGLAGLGPILDSALALRGALPALFGAIEPPLRLDAPRLALAAERFDAAALEVLPLLEVEHAAFDVRPGRGRGPVLERRAAATPVRAELPRPLPAFSEPRPALPAAPARPAPLPAARDPWEPREPREFREDREAREPREPQESRVPREEPAPPPRPRFEEVSLFDLDDDARPN